MSNYQFHLFIMQLSELETALNNNRSIFISVICSLGATIITIVVAFIIYRKQLKQIRIERIIVLLTHITFYYFPLHQLFSTWKSDKKKYKENFREIMTWEQINKLHDITDEIDILAKISLNKNGYEEIFFFNKYLFYLFEVAVNEVKETEAMYKDYKILSTDQFNDKIMSLQNLLIQKLNRRTRKLNEYKFAEKDFEKHRDKFIEKYLSCNCSQ